MKKLIIVFFISVMAFSAQVGGHIAASRIVWYSSNYACDQLGIQEPFKTIIKYGACLESHRVMDRAINEGAINWQVDVGATTYIIGYFLVPDEEKPDYLQYATLGIAYDLWDKGTGRHDFHNYNGPMIFDFPSSNIELAERLCLLSLRVKISF